MLRSPFTNAWSREALLDSKAVERSEAVKARKAYEAVPANKIAVRPDDSSRRPWAREIEKGLRQRRRYLSSDESLAHTSVEGDGLSVSVSPPLFERVILIVDALAKASVDRGFLPARRKYGEALRVKAEAVPMRLELKEKLLRRSGLRRCTSAFRPSTDRGTGSDPRESCSCVSLATTTGSTRPRPSPTRT